MSTANDMNDCDPHFGSDEEMLAWCTRAGIEPIKDAAGEYDWLATVAKWEAEDPDTR